jgi:hypothetical protein
VLGEEAEIGTLAVGSRADVTVLEERMEDWPMRDGQGEILMAQRRWIPRLVLRAGQPVAPTLRLGATSRRRKPPRNRKPLQSSGSEPRHCHRCSHIALREGHPCLP